MRVRETTHTERHAEVKRGKGVDLEEKRAWERKNIDGIYNTITPEMLSLSCLNRCVRTRIYLLPHMEMKQVSVRLIRNPGRS